MNMTDSVRKIKHRITRERGTLMKLEQAKEAVRAAYEELTKAQAKEMVAWGAWRTAGERTEKALAQVAEAEEKEKEKATEKGRLL